ncbi:MAG: hypothetical protein ACI9MR_004117 [Myxococcota bacterium]|jgi:hypothetical protein
MTYGRAASNSGLRPYEPGFTVPSSLPQVPTTPVNPRGEPYRGIYRGALDTVRWGYPRGWSRGQVERALTRKRWFRVTASDGDTMVMAAIIDQGYAGWGWCWVTSLRDGATLAFHRGVGIPLSTLVVGPVAGAGAEAFLKLPWGRISVTRGEGDTAFKVACRFRGTNLALSLDTVGAPAPCAMIGETGPIAPSYTQYSNGLSGTGTVTTKGTQRTLRDAVGCITYANGFFPRAASWREATASAVVAGKTVGLALSTTPLLGKHRSNIVWLDGEPHPVGPLQAVQSEADAVMRWTTDDGCVDLSFTPRDRKPMRLRAGIVDLKHCYAAGTFAGTIEVANQRHAIAALPGVSEQHGVLW